MLNFSTGLRNNLVNSSGLGSLMNSGAIYVYSGTKPTTPDNAPNGTLLAIVTTEGRTYNPSDDAIEAGLRLQLFPPGGLVKVGVWRLVGQATGTATWFRWCSRGYDGFGFSETRCRIDGDIGSELQLTETAITAATRMEIESFLMMLTMAAWA